MPTTQKIVHAEMVKHLVQKTIQCPQTGEILDTRTCAVLVDADGDPFAVLSPTGWAKVSANTESMAVLTSAGIRHINVEVAS